MTAPKRPDPEDTEATLKRIYALVETTTFANENEREALVSQLNALRRAIGENDGQNLPASLHEALQTTEVLAIKQLVNTSNADEDSDHGEPTWKDLTKAIEGHISIWEANHPTLAMSFAKFTDVLSKLGI